MAFILQRIPPVMPSSDQCQATLIMVRTRCCEGYKTFGTRCAICPNRPENRDNVLKYREESRAGLGCGPACTAIHPSAVIDSPPRDC